MIKTLLMLCFRLGLTVCYLPFRLLRPKDKVVFLSRQTDTPSLDFRLLADAIRNTAPQVQVVLLCRRIPRSLGGKIGYGFHLFTQMFHLATARAAVVDGYCISACLLPHRKQLKIFQIWHALGLLKNFGYAALDSSEGSSSATARVMRMHKGYHKIVCSSPQLIHDIAPCYHADPEQMLPCGLPRMDYLRDGSLQFEHREQIFRHYPILANGKPVVLYAPTFRKQGAIPHKELADAMDLTRFHLMVKLHDGQEVLYTDHGVYQSASGLSGLEWLSVAQWVVTDYSALLFEALVAQKPVILYCYDWEQYDLARGFGVDYNAIPLPHCVTPQQVATQLTKPQNSDPALCQFIQRHLSAENCTTTLCSAILTDGGLLPSDPISLERT